MTVKEQVEKWKKYVDDDNYAVMYDGERLVVYLDYMKDKDGVEMIWYAFKKAVLSFEKDRTPNFRTSGIDEFFANLRLYAPVEAK